MMKGLQRPYFFKWIGLPLVLLLAVAGCAHQTPDTGPVEQLPERFSGSGEAMLPAQFWQAFADAELDALVQQALQNNHSLRATGETLVQARAVLRQRNAARWPSVDMNLSAQRIRGESDNAGDVFAGGLAASYELEGWTLQAVPCEWQQCLEQTRDGTIDLMPDVAWSEERAAFLSFHTIPALFSWSQLYSQGNLRLASLLDLQGRRIAVLKGSVQQEYLKNLLDSFGIQAELLPQNSLLDGFALVASGGADAAVANQRFGDYQAPSFGFRDTSIMFQPARLFYASGKGRNGALLAAIDQRLQSLQADNHSVYYQILERWGGQPLPRRIPTTLWWGLAALVAMLFVAVAGNLWLRRRVAAQTRHILNEEKRLNNILHH